MKTTRYILIYIMVVMAIGTFAQVSPQPQSTQPATQPPTSPTQQQPQPNPAQPQMTNPALPGTMGLPPVTDPAMTQRLQSNFQSQNPGLNNQSVNWYNNSGNGYLGTTSNNNANYMMQYDNQGNFQQTYTQGNYNNAPANVRSSLQNSQYNSQQVTGYWISSDPNQASYYLQTTDSQGKVTGLWADQNGKLSTTPPNNPKE